MIPQNQQPAGRFLSDPANLVLLSLALATLVIHMLAAAFTAYGYFRDELYYIACAEHLALGYVDQPPFSIYMLAVNRLLLGDSLVALRFLPALACAVTVFLTGLMARELGGGRFAQTLAAAASLVSPIYVGMNSIFSMNSFDILVWTAAAYVLILILKIDFDNSAGTMPDEADTRHLERGSDSQRPSRRVLNASGTADVDHPERPTATFPPGWRESKDEPPTTETSPGRGSRRMRQARYWLLLGLILGIGLLNKISVLWLGAGIAAGLLLTPHRRWLRTPWP